jgi:hypothetical protein
VSLTAIILAAALAGPAPAVGLPPPIDDRVQPKALTFEARPPRKAVAGQPIHLLVGIKNESRAPIAFVRVAGADGWTRAFSYILESDDPSNAVGGGTESGSPHAVQPGDRWCPSADDVMVLPPGAQVFRMHTVTLDPQIVGQVAVTLEIRLLRADLDLTCNPAEFLEGTARTRFTIHPPVRPASSPDAGR